MKIILENVVKGSSLTGVAKIEDAGVILNNVPFSVRSKADLDIFVDNLLKIQAEFSTVSNGEYTASPVPVIVIDPIQKALNDVYEAQRLLELKVITQLEYDAVVAIYKALLTPKP